MTFDHRQLTSANIDDSLATYEKSFGDIGTSIEGLRGKELIEALKRKRLGHGPYPKVTLFEAANRIMSDLVILHGVKSLLKSRAFPFESYTVELGHENNNDFDLTADNGKETLVGEAFNVATSLFGVKKSSALKKLRTKSCNPAYQILMFNHDAVVPTYKPKPWPGEYLILVDITESTSRILSVDRAGPLVAEIEASHV